MTTSSRIMEHQHSIHTAYSHSHPIHPLHPFSMSSDPHSHTTSRSSNPLPPLAYLTEAAAAVSSAGPYNNKENHRLEYGAPALKRNGDSAQEMISRSQKDDRLEGSRKNVYSNNNSPDGDHNGFYNNKSDSNSDVSKGDLCTSLPREDSEMNAVPSDIQRRGSRSIDHNPTITPTPSPHGRPSEYSYEHSQSSSYQRYSNESHSNHDIHHQLASPENQYYSNNNNNNNKHHDQDSYPQKHLASHSSQATPSPPLPTQDGFQSRILPPIEPSHPLHTYMSNSRRGSLADPEYYPHNSSSNDPHNKRSVNSMDTSNSYGNDSRHFPTTSPLASTSTPTSDSHYPYPHPTTSPMQYRQPENGLGRRESLPSIHHRNAGPIGQLLAQEPQRRHSIANGDQVGPLKRKTSTPLSQVHSSIEHEHPAKRRDSIPDAALPHHLANLHPHHPHSYHSRNSLSAPSSPPRRGSTAHAHGQVPVLNLQPAVEIKPSSSPSQPSGPPTNMDHNNRPLFPLHQPRRPSLLSEASLSRRSSIADVHHYPSHFQPPSGHPHSSASQEYDHNMNIDMERMHLSGSHGSAESSSQGQHHTYSGSNGAHGQGSHLYPGYSSSSSGYVDGAGAKGDTPYSRSPELRISHKLAERKRRKEMKELFDELRDSLPVDRSLKTSKWEILSKAVDYISSMKANRDEMTSEIEMLRQELARLQK